MTDEKVTKNAIPEADVQEKTGNTATTPKTEKETVLIPIKFNKEVKELTVEEATELAQKGLKYDLISEDYKTLRELSAQNGKSVAQFLSELKTKREAKRRKELAEKCGGDVDLAEHILKLETKKDYNNGSGFAELKEQFPEFNAEDELPDEVLEAARLKGTLLLDEYLRYRLAESKRAGEAQKKQKLSENVSIGSQLNRKGADSPETAEFLRGLWK